MLRKPNFETKNNHFEKSHNAEKCTRGAFGLFENQFVAKYQKNERPDPSVSSGFANARKSFWLKQGLELATTGFPLNRLVEVTS